ncbi:MAG: hypothetical protein ACI3ZH_05965 [Candidatus Cryptobacteroides sp.]|nr:hypothetical protein [Bacteroidales bacterium]MDD6053457.1 hypothetical protein [Bacteroidales bacterium]
MDNTADLNAINAILMIAAAILLVLWLVWVVRLAACRHRMKTKNRMLLSRLEELQAEKRRAMSYEDIIDSYGNARAEEEAGFVKGQREFRKLCDRVRQSRIYRNRSVSKDELVSLTMLEKAEFDQMFKDHSPVQSLSEWLDGFRLEEAVTELRVMKADEKAGKDKTASVDENGKALSADKLREKKLQDLAARTGFSSRKQLDKACRRIIGMTLHELVGIS